MVVADPVADFITRIKNAVDVKKTSLSLPYSKLVESIAEILKREGYISSVGGSGKGIHKMLDIGLSYGEDGSSKIHSVKRLSKLSKRTYKGAKELMPVKSGLGTLVLSTPEGIMTGKEARKKNVGGELLFLIW